MDIAGVRYCPVYDKTRNSHERLMLVATFPVGKKFHFTNQMLPVNIPRENLLVKANFSNRFTPFTKVTKMSCERTF